MNVLWEVNKLHFKKYSTYHIRSNATPDFYSSKLFLGEVLFKFDSHGVVLDMGFYQFIAQAELIKVDLSFEYESSI